MSTSRRLALLLALALAMGPWAALGAAQPENQPPSLKIGVSLGLTGPYEQIGRLQQKAWVKQKHPQLRGDSLAVGARRKVADILACDVHSFHAPSIAAKWVALAG